MQEKNFASKRIKNVLIMLGMTVILGVALGVVCGFFTDQIIATALISILFFTLFVLCLIHNRMSAQLSNHTGIDYTQIRNIYCICCVFIFASSYLPEYIAPVFLLTLLLAVTSNEFIGMAAGIYFDIILCLTIHADFYELCAYVLLSLFGCVLTGLLKEKKNRIWLYLIIFCTNIIIPCIFHFLAAYSFDFNLLIYTAAGGVITDLLILLFFDKINQYTLDNKSRGLAEIISDDYPLVEEIRKYSKSSYNHAKKVSELCEKCAGLIGADAAVAKAAGFYYRIGRIQGEKPYVENGVLLAQNDCFPSEVIQILSEYNGELHLPSTRESALVHMIDVLVTKFEIFDKTTVSSSWNYEIVIYQTLNETSSSGIYDESGLTMNQFLKIREFFVKGENLF